MCCKVCDHTLGGRLPIVLSSPLHQVQSELFSELQVLLVTRSEHSESRLAALEVVYNIVSRLREEYLVLLPESLPFLSELMEDSDIAVEARTQELVKLLEELADEKLDDYLKP